MHTTPATPAASGASWSDAARAIDHERRARNRKLTARVLGGACRVFVGVPVFLLAGLIGLVTLALALMFVVSLVVTEPWLALAVASSALVGVLLAHLADRRHQARMEQLHRAAHARAR